MSRITDNDFDVGPFKKRLRDYAEANYKSFRDFEDSCGLTHAGLSAIGKQGPTLSYLAKIASADPKLNMNWLIDGEGDMMADGYSDKTEGIPLLPFSAMAGKLSENTPIGTTEVIDRYVIPDFSARGADCAIRVDGDSMWPRYANGDILAIRKLQDVTFFQWGKVYVLSTNQGCVIKRLFPDPSDEDGIICHSENAANYPDYKITKSDIYGVAIVVGHAGIE